MRNRTPVILSLSLILAGTAAYPQEPSSAKSPPAPSAAEPRILLRPSVLAALRRKAAANDPVWRAFKARLDAQVGQVIGGGYQGSQLSWITDYALGYQVLKTADPATAAAYADKALGLLKDGLRDYQKGYYTSKQYLARGDGHTSTFRLADADLVHGTLKVFLAPVRTKKVVRGSRPDTADAVDYYTRFLKVSNRPDGSADYREGVDWRHNPDLPANQIDWSPPGREPAPGASYYVTEMDWFASGYHEVKGWTRDGTSLTLPLAPPPEQAVVVEYLHGRHAADGSSLAYQQTGCGGGGFCSIFIDTTYPSRYLGKHLATGYDWLYDYPGFSPALKAEAAGLLVRWADFVREHGYSSNTAADNYGAGGYVSRAFTALALRGRDPNGDRLGQEVLAWRRQILVPQLTGPPPSLKGGFWAEGWNYGQLATRNLLLAGLGLEAAGLIPAADAEHAWASQVILHLIEAQPTPETLYDGGDSFQYPMPFVGKDLLYLLAATADDGFARAFANYAIQKYAGPDTHDFQELLFHDPEAAAAFWSFAPRQYRAEGTGLVTARADWSYTSTWLAFQLGNLLPCNHQTFAPGHLEMQRGGGILLCNANAVGENQNPNAKSQYANLVAVDDLGDGLQNYRWGMGGWYGRPGCFLYAYEADSDSVYAAGDYHAAYSRNTKPGQGGPCRRLTRQVVYVRPDLVVVYDRAATVKASYPKRLQWHLLEAPAVSGDAWAVTVGSARLFGQTFAGAALRTEASQVPVSRTRSVWRVAVSNREPAEAIHYVTALQSAPASTPGPWATHRVASTDDRLEGVQAGDQVVLFGVEAALSPFRGVVGYTIAPTGGPLRHLVVDLEPKRTYTITVDGKAVGTAQSSGQGVLHFTTPAGGQAVVIR